MTHNRARTGELANKIFGDKPFEIVLVRTPGDNDVLPQWDIGLPLESQKERRRFEEIVMNCIAPVDDTQSSAATISARPTNIGDEVEFAFVNAHFSRRGKRRLTKAFKASKQEWDTAKNAVTWACDKGNLMVEVEKQSVALSVTDPTKVMELDIQIEQVNSCPDCRRYHIPHDYSLEPLFGIGMAVPGVLKLFDKECQLARSTYFEPVMNILKMLLIKQIKDGMKEYVMSQQRSILDSIPREMLAMLADFTATVEDMRSIGIEIELDSTMGMLQQTLRQHIKEAAAAKAEVASPAQTEEGNNGFAAAN